MFAFLIACDIIQKVKYVYGKRGKKPWLREVEELRKKVIN